MLCCLGLFAGYAVGSMLGGPWMFITPATGFGLGFVGDMRLMRGSHGGHGGFGGGCCGGGHMHGGKAEGYTRDAVCGMEVDEKTKYVTEFDGEAYYFCSQGCLSAFKKAPWSYAK